MMTCSTRSPVHILIFPFPAKGHLLPLLDLTHHLLTRGGASLTATIAITPNHLPLLSNHPEITSFVLPSDVGNTSFISDMDSLRLLRDPLLAWLADHPSPPSVIISDMFLGWTHTLGLKRLVFSPSAAHYLALVHSLWKNLPPPPEDDNDVVLFGLSWYQLSALYRAFASGEPGSEFLREEFLLNVASYGFVVNTFHSLERDYLAHLVNDLGHHRVWAVGPLSEVANGPLREGSCDENNVLGWLDECGDGEVVYVSFGSLACLSDKQLEVLALGLETSGVRFVWKINEPKGHVYGNELPHGFEDRVARRGLVLRGWAPQVLILRHRAVGAFLTHCGWNSVLEGLSAGVMMLAWPLGADQYSDAILLVDRLKVGIMVGQGARSLPHPDDLARILADSVSGACDEYKSRVLELKMLANEAISEGGSSLVGLDDLIQHLSNLSNP